MDWKERLQHLLDNHTHTLHNIPRREMIRHAVEHREAIISESGALATWTPPESTGRSPKDTVIVRRSESEEKIDWDSPNNISITEETMDIAIGDALDLLAAKAAVFVTERVIGADAAYALPVRVVTDRAITSLFAENMFRPVPDDIGGSVFAEKPFTLIVLPYDKLDTGKYAGRLRDVSSGRPSDMIVAMDMDRMIGVIIGSAYCGSTKKLMFTVMNYLLPGVGILPLHCSANEGANGDCALLLGLSGTGKTTLSADPSRALLGDDEHGWSDNGIANFEYGCYAKFIDLDAAKEPEIYHAVMHHDDVLDHGAIVENAMVYPDGVFDFSDSRFTPNSRASYPLRYLSNIKPESTSTHPKTILFLTADANGVLPPVSKLTAAQAMFWFLMGYTSKLAGTETGVKEPQSTFSRFFGQPFMPLNPDMYAEMLGEKMREHGTQVYLVNTGWCGAPYGEGKRMDITLTRTMVEAALSGKLANVEYEQDPVFKVHIPKTCPGVPSEILNPRNVWKGSESYESRAGKLAADFSRHFRKAYGNKNIDPLIAAECPEQSGMNPE
ncbi:phosphoenolpyruvate carboxykinase (ATP) [bacterium]|nr:phosphoenolpyruvate carboxykinase (ATP) [bacterium]